MKIEAKGHSLIITTDLTVDQLAIVNRIKPEALKVTDENGDVVFSLGLTSSSGTVCKGGVRFSDTTFNTDGKATITAEIRATSADEVRDFVAHEYAGAIRYIKEFETSIPALAAQLKAEEDALKDSICF